MSVLREYAIAAYFACCRIFSIFQQSAHIAFFPDILAFSTAILIESINQYSIYEDYA